MQFISPFSWVICRLWCQLALISVAIYLLLDTYGIINGFDNYGVRQHRSFNLEIIGTNPQMEQTDIGKIEITLLLRGCALWTSGFLTIQRVSETVKTINLNASSLGLPMMAVDGFQLTFEGKSNSSSPLLFVLAGSDDNWATRQPVVSSDTRFVAEGVRFLGVGSTDWTDGGTLLFENRLTWPLILLVAVHPILFSFLCVSAAVCGLFNMPVAGKRVVALSCVLITLTLLISIVGNICLGDRKDYLYRIALTITFVAVGTILMRNEYYLTASFSSLGLLIIAARIVEDVAVFDDPGYLRDAPPYSGMAFFLIGLVFVAQRSRYLRRATLEAQSGGKSRAGAWRCLLAKPGGPAALRVLADATDRLAAACTRAQPRHRTRRWSGTRSSDAVVLESLGGGGGGGFGGFGGFGGGGHRASGEADLRPVTSLDQLYTQAMCLAPYLHEKVTAAGSRPLTAINGRRSVVLQRGPKRNDWDCIAIL